MIECDIWKKNMRASVREKKLVREASHVSSIKNAAR